MVLREQRNRSGGMNRKRLKRSKFPGDRAFPCHEMTWSFITVLVQLMYRRYPAGLDVASQPLRRGILRR